MSHPVYRFGDCTIHAAARELYCRGRLVTLSPKVFDCLIYLIEHRDRAVGRDELIAAVWGKVDVTDTLLGQTVLKARRAVARDGEEQSAIRTVPRFGYRWIADVRIEECDDAAPAPDDRRPGATPQDDAAAQDDARATPRSAASRRWLFALVFALVAAAAGWYYVDRFVMRAHTRSPPTASDDTVAVLPVEVDAGTDFSWVRLGVMDLVASRLRGAGQPIVPSDNVVALARTSSDLSAATGDRVRAATDARYVIGLRASRTADGWTVQARMQDRDGSIREIEARNPDAIAAGRAASDRLLAMLGLHPPGETLALSSSEILQRAESAMLSEDLDEARRLLENAAPPLRDSPDARIRLAHIDLRAGRFADARARIAALLTDLPAEAEPAMRARALNILGSIEIRTDHFAAGERAFGEAIALIENRREPDVLGQVYMGRGVTRAAQGRYDDALADFSRSRIALQLAGDSLALARVEANEGLLEATRNRYADAIPTLRRAEDRFEKFGVITERATLIGGEIDAYLDLLDPTEALAASERAWSEIGRLQSARVRHALQLARARALAASGRVTEARALLAELVREADPEVAKMPIARARAEQARLDLADGGAATAAALAASAIADLTGADDVRTRAATWLVMLRALRASHEDARAATETTALGAWAGESGSHVAMIYAELARAEQAWSERRADDARSAYVESLRLAGEDAAPVDLAEVVVSYGNALIADGELDRAGAVVGQIARWADRDFGCALLQVRFYRALQQEDAWRHALVQARAIAGERAIPSQLSTPTPHRS